MTIFWSLAPVVTGAASAMRRGWGFHAFVIALFARFGCDLALSGFRQMQVVWPVIGASLLANRYVTASERETDAADSTAGADFPDEIGPVSFGWSARWRSRFLVMGISAVGGPLLVFTPIARAGIAPMWLPILFPGALLAVFAVYFFSLYPTRIEFAEGRVSICHLFGKEIHLSRPDIESIEPEYEISPSSPKGIALHPVGGRKLIVPPFFEGFGKLRARLQHLASD